MIAEAAALSAGDLIVHVEHGVGRYDGLRTVTVNEAPHDCLELIYAGGDKILLPVENVELISRYGAESGEGALDKLGHCERCNTLSETPVCAVCASSRRDASLLCVVETPADQITLEQSGAFSGLYFVLLGRLSPLDGVGPGQIHLEKLVNRATDGTVKEVILATNFTNEGEVTAHVITELLEGQGVKVSRLARGIPIGSELEYVDAATVAQAVRERR